MSDVTADLRRGHTSSHQRRPGAITAPLQWQSGKHKHLLYLGGGILSEKMQYALDTIQSVSSGLVCAHNDCVSPVWFCVCVGVCRGSGETERGESRWDRSALGWHAVRQTHFITGLFTWLTGLLYQLHSTRQHATVSDTPAPWKLPSLPHPHKQTRMQFANTKPDLPTDCLSEWLARRIGAARMNSHLLAESVDDIKYTPL